MRGVEDPEVQRELNLAAIKQAMEALPADQRYQIIPALTPVFIKTAHQLSEKQLEDMGRVFYSLGLQAVVLPPGAEIADRQSFVPETLDVDISLKYGGCEPPRIWESMIDGKTLPPHSRVEIVIQAGECPTVKVKFEPLLNRW